jgi:hypothetical protein
VKEKKRAALRVATLHVAELAPVLEVNLFVQIQHYLHTQQRLRLAPAGMGRMRLASDLPHIRSPGGARKY